MHRLSRKITRSGFGKPVKNMVVSKIFILGM